VILQRKTQDRIIERISDNIRLGLQEDWKVVVTELLRTQKSNQDTREILEHFVDQINRMGRVIQHYDEKLNMFHKGDE